MRSLIPLADEARLILFDILDTDWPIGLNPLTGIDVAQAGAKDQALSQIMAIFARLDPSTWGKAPAMKEFVQMATLLVFEGEPQPTLAHVKQCLLDAAYRERLIPQCTNLDVLTFWTVTFPTQGEQQRSSLHALLRRFSQLLTTETTRYMVSQPASRLNLLDAIERGLIILAPLPHVTLGDLASAVGMLLLQQFVRAALSRPGTDQSRHTYPLVIDELQVFIGKEGDSSDIQTAITQLRGLGIAGIYAHQSLSQLGQMQAEMLQNSGSRIMLRTQEPDASIYARYYATSGITANDIAGQDANEHQYAALHCDNERTGLFSMQVLPWPTPCLPVVVPDERTDWRLLTPPDSPDPAFDQELVQLVYFPVAHPAELVRELADYDDALWQWTLARWEAIRRFQRQYVLAHPGCVALDERIVDPDPAEQAVRRTAQQRLDRQRWLSRLLVATPRILAAAEYARIRRAIEPEASPSRARPVRSYEPPGFSAGRALPAPTSTGYVDGAAQPGERPPPIRSGDQKTVEQVLRERGQRRRRDTLAPGYDDADGLGLFDTSTTAAHPSSHTISESEGE